MRAPQRIAIDTNLLVLLVTGLASPDYIRKHKNLRQFAVGDYEMLDALLAEANEIFVTPHVLAETSSLAAQIGDPVRQHIRIAQRMLLDTAKEKFIVSHDAMARAEYPWLGLTDSALLELSHRENAAILSTDLKLCHVAATQGLPAINFNHLRDPYYD